MSQFRHNIFYSVSCLMVNFCPKISDLLVLLVEKLTLQISHFVRYFKLEILSLQSGPHEVYFYPNVPQNLKSIAIRYQPHFYTGLQSSTFNWTPFIPVCEFDAWKLLFSLLHITT